VQASKRPARAAISGIVTAVPGPSSPTATDFSNNLMLGFLLARAGVDVIVLEKHADFLRDFRGDTIHPSTLENMHELGLLEAFLRLPHQELRTLTGTRDSRSCHQWAYNGDNPATVTVGATYADLGATIVSPWADTRCATGYRGFGWTVMPHHIGIVACSAEGAALCYRTICVEGAELLGPHAHPEVSMHTPSLADTMAHIYRNDWQSVGEVMLASAHKLTQIGADFLICPDNTIHQALPFIASRSPRPWLHIAEVVADVAVTRGFRRLGLMGTRWLVDSEVYPEKLAARGLEFMRPTTSERDEINRIIMDELVCSILKPEAIAYHQQVIRRMKEEGCDAVVLGCTEIPLIMSDANSPLPTLDSTRLLARAALRRAAKGTRPR
jgi:aspartate racemase